MEAELWDSTDTFNTSDFQSACSTSMSGDSLVNLVISRGLTSQKETWIKKPVRRGKTRITFTMLALNLYFQRIAKITNVQNTDMNFKTETQTKTKQRRPATNLPMKKLTNI